MTSTARLAWVLLVTAIAASPATRVHAQQAPAPAAPAPPTASARQVLSANPFGLLIGLFNAEYERRVSESVTAGIGGSTYVDDDEDDYVNGDLFVRYYPSGNPLDGWSFGVKAGATKVADSGTYFGFGFDTNWSWLLGKKDNFYVGVGFGLKRLFGVEDGDFEYVPTLRIVNIGIAF